MSVQVTRTYNPIIESNILQSGLLNTQIPKSLPGSILLLSRERGFSGVSGLKLVENEISNGDLRFGRYKAFYRVDISPHIISFNCTLPAKDIESAFTCEITVHCKVHSPLYIIAHNIKDVALNVSNEITLTLHSVSQEMNVYVDNILNILREQVQFSLNEISLDWLDIQTSAVQSTNFTQSCKAIREDYYKYAAIQTNDPIRMAMQNSQDLLDRANQVRIIKHKGETIDQLHNIETRKRDGEAYMDMIKQTIDIQKGKFELLKMLAESHAINEDVYKNEVNKLLSDKANSQDLISQDANTDSNTDVIYDPDYNTDLLGSDPF